MTEGGEYDPVAWFELEEEWDEVDIIMPQCKTAKVNRNTTTYFKVEFISN